MRLAKVTIDQSYVVDLDDEVMVQEAKNNLYEDLMNAVKYNELFQWIELGNEDPTLKPEDITECLRKEPDDC